MHVVIYTDGAARHNPEGPGAYAAILQYTDAKGKVHEREYSGGYNPTTNNRMELMGVIAGLEALVSPCSVDLYSDSQYVINSFNEHWIDRWMTHDWKLANGNPVKNKDLWERLLLAASPHTISWHWVKGHDKNELNNRCDALATHTADGMKGQKKPNLDPASSLQSSEDKTNDSQKSPALPQKKKKSKKERKHMQETLQVLYHSDKIDRLEYIEGKSDWIDLRAAKEYHLRAGEFALIDLGISLRLPKGYELITAPRSSTFKNYGLLQSNGIGVVDESYCGDNDVLKMPVYATRDTVVHVNDRICQFRIQKHQPELIFEEVETLGGTDRGGFGSTGVQ